MLVHKYKNILIFLTALLLVAGCSDSPQRHLKLGNWYFQKGLMDEAILEYREVTRMLTIDSAHLSRQEYVTLAKAHYSLALAYTKKGWYDYALRESELCFNLQPTDENLELVKLIQKRLALSEAGSDS